MTMYIVVCDTDECITGVFDNFEEAEKFADSVHNDYSVYETTTGLELPDDATLLYNSTFIPDLRVLMFT
jgi:hypothetical protein